MIKLEILIIRLKIKMIKVTNLVVVALVAVVALAAVETQMIH